MPETPKLPPADALAVTIAGRVRRVGSSAGNVYVRGAVVPSRMTSDEAFALADALRAAAVIAAGQRMELREKRGGE